VCFHQLRVQHVLLGRHKTVLTTTTVPLFRHHNCHTVSPLPWCWLHYSAAHVPAYFSTCLLQSSEQVGFCNNTAHCYSTQTTNYVTNMVTLFLPVCKQQSPYFSTDFIYALCSKVSVTLGGINIVSVTMSCLMASCYFHSSTPHLSFQMKH